MYDFKRAEAFWQEFWEREHLFDMPQNESREKFYVLGMYAYPSGDAHMGHVRNYTITDVIARYKRMNGCNVLHPTGWDAFGLPTENAAFKRNIEPQKWNTECTAKMKQQFQKLGFSYDWDKVIDTSHPEYYHWTQWLLIRFWEKGLLYRDIREVNWCPSCNTVLANEQVENGKCERCKSVVIPKKTTQWFLKTTAYANRLTEDLNLLKDWPPRVIAMQRNWIGKQKDGSFRLRDWCVSRQRYWGAPIPFVICPKCGIRPVPDQELPVKLPLGVDITPGWPPPLARIPSFVETTCPKCGGAAERATDVLDTFVFSAWYFLRFTDPHNTKAPFDSKWQSYWMDVDLYVGGVEHATVHLIYARFFHKVLYDLGLVDRPEPFKRLFVQGMVCLKGEKMSKSKGNIVTPVEILDQFGADALRAYILFVGPPELDVDWQDNGIRGCHRFVERMYSVLTRVSEQHFQKDWRRLITREQLADADIQFRGHVHRTISRITETIEKTYHFNTVISAFMEVLNNFEEYLKTSVNPVVVSEAVEILTLVLSPFVPHLAEEVWRNSLGQSNSVCVQRWPSYEPSLAFQGDFQIIIQVNGKKKGVLDYDDNQRPSKEEVEESALKFLRNKEVVLSEGARLIYVPNRVINFITKK
ncbi:MAG: class I tRNA ligase family protein [Candidatus Moranbacteria bacterium]|nr:class I tRNA ligase family protein [Candidatus Moranbacteria bacterium]